MRITLDQRIFIKTKIKEFAPAASVYLFGSRVDNQASGGDIDILVISDHKISSQLLRGIKREFYKKFGWQKLDIVNFRQSDDNTFKSLIIDKAIAL